MSNKAILVTVTLKGTAMAFIITVIADATFIQGLATAVASACVSGAFLLVSISMTNKRTEEKAQQVKKEVLEGQQKATDEVVKKVEENN